MSRDRSEKPGGVRPEVWIPLLYAAVAGSWIAFSDLLLTAVADSVGEQGLWSMVKGFGFVLVTALLLHAWLRRAAARERRARSEIERGEALLRAVTDAVPDAIFLKDRDSRWLFANPAAQRALGKREADVLGKEDRALYADQGVAAALIETDRRIMESGLTEVVEEIIQTPQGYRIYLTTKAPYRDEQGRVVGIVGNARDITEQKRAELARGERLRLEKRMASIAASVPGLLCAFRQRPGTAGSLPFSTPAVEDLFGFAQEELARDFGPVARRIPSDDLKRFVAASEQARRARSRFHYRFRYDHPTKGLRWIEGWALPAPDPEEDGILWYGYLVDVTEQQRIEEQLQQAQKLESIGRLAGGVAHDFNNVLTVVLSCTEEIQEALRSGGPVNAEEVAEIRGAAERARELTRQLLAVARRQVIAPVTLDLNAIVQGSERLLRRVLGEDVELAIRLEPGLAPARADAGQLEQVILNLALNARDAMPGGGTLTLETRSRLDPPAPDGKGGLAGPELGPGPWVSLTVRDSGTGMLPDVREHVFEPFFTTKPGGQGTGLGLAMVYGIVAQSGGSIRLETEPGRGTAFEILLPRAEGEPTRVESRRPVPVEATARGGEETILVVEDDPAVRDVTARSLRGAGYRVLTASNGREALALENGEMEKVQLLVTDVVMPGVDGIGVAEALRKRNPGLRVVFVSGYARDVIAARPGGPSDVEILPKPFTPSTLLARVRAVLEAPVVGDPARASGSRGS